MHHYRVALGVKSVLMQEGQLKPLFEVTKMFISCHDDQVDIRDQMIEKKKVYGSLLYSCDLMEMTDDRVETETRDMKEKLFAGTLVGI